MLPSDRMLPGQDWLVRRVTDLERRVRELFAGRRLEAATIGAGGLTVQGGRIAVVDEAGNELAVLSSEGIFIEGDQLVLPGKVEMFAGAAGDVPDGWLICDGSAVARLDFPRLWDAIGERWGAGDGVDTFNVPDLRDRVLLGAGSTHDVGDTGGTTSHSHTNPRTGNGGSHSHTNPSTSNAGAHNHGTDGSHSHGSAGGHSHGGATGGPSATSDRDVTGTVAAVAHQAHTHNISGSGSHSHGSAGSHAHDSASNHSHNVGNTGSEPSHDHSVGDTGTADHLPPFAAVVPIIRY